MKHAIVTTIIMLLPIVSSATPDATNHTHHEVLDLLDNRLSLYGYILIGVLSVFSGMFILIARWSWSRHMASDVRIDDVHHRITDNCKEVTDEINSHKVEVARIYAPRVETNDIVDRAIAPVKQRVDEIYTLLNSLVKRQHNGRPQDSS